jgi:putative polyhydroxyalkanoate system protein
MADISLSKKHGMELSEAQAKVNDIISAIEDEFGNLVSDISWNSDKTVADLKGKGFTGKFRVDEQEVGIDVSLKLFAKPLKGKVEGKIKEKMEHYFG